VFFAMCPSIKRGTAGRGFILAMLITSNLLCNIHGSDAT
jgi:hypothetical protein